MSEDDDMLDNIETYSVMVASTAHCNESGEIDTLFEDDSVSTVETPYGFKLYLNDDILEYMQGANYSEGLKLCILAAVSTNCQYIEFDSDGPIYDEVPMYDW